MVKKKFKQLQDKHRKNKLQKAEGPKVPRITNENVAEHREEILGGARKYIYPLQHSKHRIVLLTTTLVIVTILVFTTACVWLLYRQQTTSPFMYQVTKVLPFPVARSGNTFIAYENYLFELRHYIHYYETQQELSFDTESGQAQLEDYKQRALNNVIDLAYIKRLAKENNVTVSEDEVNEQIRIAREQNRLGSSDEVFEDVLRNYWNWSVDDFRRSLRSELLRQNVTRELDQAAQSKAREALAKLKSGTPFEEVAKEYSDEEGTAENGGNFGVVNPSNRNVSQQTVDTLFRLNDGEYSDIQIVPYETGYALEIVKNNGTQENGRDGSHIVVRLKDLGDTLNDMKEQNPYRMYISQ